MPTSDTSSKMPSPIEVTFSLINEKWTIVILWNLMSGTRRFGELKNLCGGITHKVLTERLRQLEENGLIVRKVYAEMPPHVEYTLSEIGYSLKPILVSMWNWGEKYMLHSK